MSVWSDVPSPLSSPGSSPICLTPSKVTSRRDEFFYFQDVAFLVEDTLFNVSRYGQMMDSAFDALFKSPRKGSSTMTRDEDPIVLEDVTASEFRLLLRMLLPLPGVDSVTDTADFTLEDWTAVLRFSSARGLATVRKVAIARARVKVDGLPIVDKILLAVRFDVEPWLNEAYDAIIGREASITPGEREKLGWETYGRLMELREQCWVNTTMRKVVSPALATGKSASLSQKKKKKGKR